MLVGCLLVAVGAVAFGAGLAAGDDASHEVEPSTLPQTGDTESDLSQDPAEGAEREDTPSAGVISFIPMEDASNIPFPSGIIGATSTYYRSHGAWAREIYAGGAGCIYGLPDGASCVANGNTDHQQIGMIIETMDKGMGPRYEAPILLPGTGLITFTRIAGDKIFFATESGTFGAYSLTARRAILYAVQAFGPPLDVPPTINRAKAGAVSPSSGVSRIGPADPSATTRRFSASRA